MINNIYVIVKSEIVDTLYFVISFEVIGFIKQVVNYFNRIPWELTSRMQLTHFALHFAY